MPPLRLLPALTLALGLCLSASAGPIDGARAEAPNAARVSGALTEQTTRILPFMASADHVADLLAANLASPDLGQPDRVAAGLLVQALSSPAAADSVQQALARAGGADAQAAGARLRELTAAIASPERQRAFSDALQPIKRLATPELSDSPDALKRSLDRFFANEPGVAENPSASPVLGQGLGSPKIQAGLVPATPRGEAPRASVPLPAQGELATQTTQPFEAFVEKALEAVPKRNRPRLAAYLRGTGLAAKRYRLDDKPAVRYIVDSVAGLNRFFRSKEMIYDDEFYLSGKSSLSDGTLTISVGIVVNPPARGSGSRFVSRLISWIDSVPMPARVRVYLSEFRTAYGVRRYTPPQEKRLAFAEVVYGVLEAAAVKVDADPSIRQVRVEGLEVINPVLQRKLDKLGFAADLSGNLALDVPIKR